MRREQWTRYAFVVVLALLLSACGGADRNDSDTAVAANRSEASSTELVDAALARGEIDADTALNHRVFALFGDDRLPAAYTGAHPEVFDATLPAQLREQWDSLSPETQDMLAPFQKRPNEPGSWTARSASDSAAASAPAGAAEGKGCIAATGWASTSGRFKVWFDERRSGSRDLAELVSRSLDDQAWPDLMASRSLLSRQVAAAEQGCGRGISLYLVHGINADALALRTRAGQAGADGAFVLVNADSAAAAPQAAARELMTAIRLLDQGDAPHPSTPPSARSRAMALAAPQAQATAAGEMPAPSIVQVKSLNLSAGAQTLTLDQPVAAGNWIVVGVSAIGSSPRNVLLSDNQGRVDAAFASTGLRYSNSFGTVWRYAKTTQAGMYSLGINRGTASSATVQVFELGDADPTTLLDIAAVSASATSKTASTTFATSTVTANNLLLTVIAARSSSVGLTPTGPTGLLLADQVKNSSATVGVYGLGVASTASYRLVASLSGKTQWRMSSLAIRGRPAPPIVLAPVNTALPVLTSVSTPAGLTLTASQGSWANAPTAYAYGWTRNGAPIVEAAQASYITSVADEGSAIAAVVTASNSAGSAGATSAAVQIPMPPPPGTPALTLIASPTALFEGQSATLSWNSTHTTSCTASGAWSGSQPTTGALSVTPAGTSTYGLDCTGDNGSVSALAQVTVSPMPLNNPATGAHGSAFHRSQGTVGPWLPTPPMATQASGSTMLVFVGKGSIYLFAPPIDNKGNSPYVQVGAINQYKKWPGEGTTTYALHSMLGGANHIVSVNDSNVWDEVSFATVEIKNGGVIQDHKWNEVLNSPNHTSLSVTTTGPATLVAAWFGDDSSSTPSNPVPNNGFTVVEAVTGAVETVQMVIATKDVTAAGTYNITWTTTPLQGAQLYLVAVQKKP